ncbi:MAG: hypothetical protein ACK4Z3_01030 [Rhizobium rosettiformans]
MTKNTETREPMTIDEAATYAVKLARVVQVGAFKYKPLDEMEMAGAMLKRIVDENGEEVLDYARQL